MRYLAILLAGICVSMAVSNMKLTRQNANLRVIAGAMDIDHRNQKGEPCRH